MGGVVGQHDLSQQQVAPLESEYMDCTSTTPWGQASAPNTKFFSVVYVKFFFFSVSNVFLYFNYSGTPFGSIYAQPDV